MAIPKEYTRLRARMEKLAEKRDRLETAYADAETEHDAAVDLFLDYCDRTGRNDATGEKWTPEEIAIQKEQDQRVKEIQQTNRRRGQK